jgi:D-alanyl-D-alanine carboxypeptidase
MVQSDDEDAAEAVRAPDEKFAVIHAEGGHAEGTAPAAKPAPQAPAKPEAKPQPAVAPMVAQNVAKPSPALGPAAPAVRPSARPDAQLAAAQTGLVKTAMNAPASTPRPQMRPSLRDDVAEGDADPMPTPGHNWTIQIGAYADKALAEAQLKAYAGKAQDVLARAAHIISPAQTAAGHTLYRARFGLYAEQEAREVCSRLTQRGQTCFAAVQSR